MLLTLFFMAFTWIQAWRFNAIKSAMKNILNQKSSISMYKDNSCSYQDVKKIEKNQKKVDHIPIRGITSSVCANQKDASLLNLHWFSSNKRVCSVLPQQQVDVTNWIAIPSEKTEFPFKLNGNINTKLDQCHVYILVESDLENSQLVQNGVDFDIEYFGIPKGWYARDLFILLLESDLNHLAELTSLFLSNNLCFSNQMEITRIETVEVKGEPCLLSVTDLSAIPKKLTGKTYGVINTKEDKQQCLQSHKKLLATICEAASNAVEKQSFIPVPELGLTVNPKGISHAKLNYSQVNGIDEVDHVESRVRSESLDALESCDKPDVCDQAESCDSLSVQSPSDPVIFRSNSSNYMSEYSSFVSTPNKLPAKNVSDSVGDFETGQSAFDSMDSLNTAYSSVSRKTVSISHHGEVATGKPPLISILSSSSSSTENVKNTLYEVLDKDRYTIHCLNVGEAISSPWIQKSRLVIIFGNVPSSVVPILLQYLLNSSGQILCICSDLLGAVLSSFQTAEVRPDEVVRLSYDKWNHVPFMHHIFCYQPSPLSDQFPSEESSSDNISARTPSAVEVVDVNNEAHTLLVKVLAVEETWQTPSFLLAKCLSSDGKVLFSQVHLEVDPSRSDSDSDKPSPANKARLEIFADLLSKHFNFKCAIGTEKFNYTPAYFLGNHELKLALLKELQDVMPSENSLKTKDLTIKFYGKGQNPPKASSNFLPVLLHSCPPKFSTVEYFDNLKSKDFGRLLIYSDVLTTSMGLLNGPKLKHGLAAISRLQTQAAGRAGNEWLSPEGSASYSMQLHIPLDSRLGQHISFIQHIASLASISAILLKPGYESLCLALKWPNDIYAGDNVKIGGVAVTSSIYNSTAVCNIGCGVNLSNSLPTTCINDLIGAMNEKSSKKLSKITHEMYFAWVFSEFERLVDLVQEGLISDVLDLYYQFWLHENVQVSVVEKNGTRKKVTIIGLDDYGFLKVQAEDGNKFSVQPDGNSFDMLSGLIMPK